MGSQHEQLHRNEQNSADLSQSDASKSNYGDGSEVIGHPVNPLHDPAGSTPPTSAASAGGAHAPSIPPTSESDNVPRDAPSPSSNFPTAQRPQALSTNQSGVSQSPTASAPPYVQSSPAPGSTGKSTPMDSIMLVFNKWGKMAEDMTGNVWNHLRTGPNVAETAFGRISLGTRAMTEGGLENVYRQTFEVDPEEHLLKTYACYLSTSTGPVAGTLYISTHKLAFCSDRPLALPADNNNTTDPPAPSATTDTSPSATSPTSNKKSSAHQQKQHQHQQQQQQHSYYKVVVPIPHVESVNPSENTEKKPPEKYVQLKTTDGHEFWFMGFVNYDKGVKNLQESLLSKTSSPNTNTASRDTNTGSQETPLSETSSPNTNTASRDTNTASHDTNTDSHVVN